MPTVIKLEQQLLIKKEAQVPASLSLEASSPRFNNLRLELDAEMSNNFEWLINFDLRSISLFDIDESIPASKEANYRKKLTDTSNLSDCHKNKLALPKYPIERENMKRTCIQIISECLTEIGEGSVATIYQWINEKYCMGSNLDTRWKRTLRHTLSVSSLFRKKNQSKPFLWCLAEEKTQDVSSQKSDVVEERILPDSKDSLNPAVIETASLPHIWMPLNPGGHDGIAEYYELSLDNELLAQEPLEVTYLLSEGSMDIY